LATRHQVRNSVVSLLYAHDFNSGSIMGFKDEVFEDKKIRNKQKEFANSLLRGVLDKLNEIDGILENKLSGNWEFDKIGKIEKAVLRLGVYEIHFEGVEKAIVINEALETIKDFGNDSASKLINGVLDSIEKAVKE